MHDAYKRLIFSSKDTQVQGEGMRNLVHAGENQIKAGFAIRVSGKKNRF